MNLNSQQEAILSGIAKEIDNMLRENRKTIISMLEKAILESANTPREQTVFETISLRDRIPRPKSTRM